MTRKRPPSAPPDVLPPDARARIKAWCADKYPKYLNKLGNLWPECRDWHLKKGELACDWEAAFRMWVRKAAEFEARRREEHRREHPQMPRTGPATSGPLAEVISLALRRRGE